jgi:tetratricopeptide (TPR) repeat protein
MREQIRTTETAIQLYRGDLLEGFYEEWILRERERLQARYLSSLKFLMVAYQQQGKWEQCLHYGRKILQIEPAREDVHRSIMRIYFCTGRRDQALKQYKRCSGVLLEEWGVEPLPETRQLYEQILADNYITRGGNPTAADVEKTPDSENEAHLFWLARPSAEDPISTPLASRSDHPDVNRESLMHGIEQLEHGLRLAGIANVQLHRAIQEIERLFGLD